MPKTIDRWKVMFFVIFAVSCVFMWTYHFLYIWPRHQCENKGDWWDSRDRVCAVPMPIWQITGRGGPHGQPVIGSVPASVALAAPAAKK